MKKFTKMFLSIALAALTALSFAACGGNEDENTPVSDETWSALTENAALLGKYHAAASAMGEDCPAELVEYIDSINERSKEVAAMTRDNTTEEEAQAANTDVLEWIKKYSQYVNIDEPAVNPDGDEAAVSGETWNEFIKYQYTMGQMMTVLAEDTPEDVAAVADDMLALSESINGKTRADFTEAEAKEALTAMTGYIGVMSPYVDVADDGTFSRKG